MSYHNSTATIKEFVSTSKKSLGPNATGHAQELRIPPIKPYTLNPTAP